MVAGNWKMNGLGADLAELDALKALLGQFSGNPGAQPCDVLICPPATLIARAAQRAQGAFAIGGQDCHANASGAFTGDISAPMLKDAGASYVILGHSERRHLHQESSAEIARKVHAAWRGGLRVILCIGETMSERQSGTQERVCRDQLYESLPEGVNAENTLIAYEPVWAIGSGVTPSAADIVAMHEHIRSLLAKRPGEAGREIPILYGGSVNPSNASQILNLAAVNGALVGGASLKAKDFYAVIAAVNRT